MGRSHVLSLVIAAALAASLRSQDDAPNVESLVLGARTDEGRARAQAIDAMYQLGPRAVAWLPALARLAADSDLPVRSLAIRLMRGVLTSAGDAVAEAALNADAEARARRKEIDRVVGANASAYVVPLVAQLARVDEADAVLDAVQILGMLGAQVRDTLPALERAAIATASDPTKMATVASIAAIDDGGAFTLRAFERALSSTDLTPRLQVVRMLPRFGRRMASCAPGVVAALPAAISISEGRRHDPAGMILAALESIGAPPGLTIAALERGAFPETGRWTTPFVRDMLRADPDGTVVVPALVRVWRRADAAEKPQLAEVLSRWDTPIPGLGDALVTLIEELDATQPATTPPTKELHTRSALHSELRWRILACLARQGPAASGALPRVLTILEREPEPRWRTQILTVLGTMDPSGSVVRPVFDAYLRDGPTPSERRIACQWRARLRPVSSEAIEDLLDRSPCDSIDEIARAALVIQDLGPRAMAATPMLLSALSDAQRWQLSTIVDALTALKTDVRPIRGALATRLARGDVTTATELLPILDRLPAPPTPTRADVERAMHAAEPDVELAFALYAMGRSGLDPATLDTCVGALSHPIPNMRWLAALALRNAGPRGLSALPALVAALERERPRESAESAPHGRGHGMLVGYRWDHIIGLEVLNVLASLGPAAKDSLPRISSALRAIFNLEADEVASCFPRQIHRIAPIPRGRVEVIADPELVVTGNRRHTATARGDFIRNMAADSEREPDGTWSVALRELQFPGEVYWSGPPPDLTLFLRRDSAGTLVVDAECRQLDHDGTTKELSTPRFVHFRPTDLRTADRLEFAYRDTFDPDSWIEFSIANPFR